MRPLAKTAFTLAILYAGVLTLLDGLAHGSVIAIVIIALFAMLILLISIRYGPSIWIDMLAKKLFGIPYGRRRPPPRRPAKSESKASADTGTAFGLIGIAAAFIIYPSQELKLVTGAALWVMLSAAMLLAVVGIGMLIASFFGSAD